MDFYWLIPTIAVGGGITYAILNSYWKSRAGSGAHGSDIQSTLDANTAASKAVLDKLETIDNRLSAVEKTLNDIP